MRKVLDELDPFFWIIAIVILGMTWAQSAQVSYTPPFADFAQAMTAPIEATP